MKTSLTEVYTDVSLRDGHVGIGWTVEQDGEPVLRGGKQLGELDVNSTEAELLALIHDTDLATEYDNVTLYTDCQTVIGHITNNVEIGDRPYVKQFIKKVKEMDTIQSVEWIPRDMNESAHEIATKSNK